MEKVAKNYKLEVIVREKTTSNGRKFQTYAVKEGTKEDGTPKWCNVKFTKDVKDLPKQHSYVIVAKDKINRDESGTYPLFWIKEVQEIIIIPREPQDLSGYFEEC